MVKIAFAYLGAAIGAMLLLLTMRKQRRSGMYREEKVSLLKWLKSGVHGGYLAEATWSAPREGAFFILRDLLASGSRIRRMHRKENLALLRQLKDEVDGIRLRKRPGGRP